MTHTLRAAHEAAHHHTLVDLYRHGTMCGRNADQLDYQAALKTISDVAGQALINGDGVVYDLCLLGMAALLQRRPPHPIPY